MYVLLGFLKIILSFKINVDTDRRYSNLKTDNIHQRTLIREWNTIGTELSDQGRWSEALDAFNKVLSMDVTNVRALAGKGAIKILYTYQSI